MPSGFLALKAKFRTFHIPPLEACSRTLKPDSPASITLTAPAKINLWLKVLHKRPEDDFHEIDTLMVPLELGDRLTLLKSDGFSFECNDPSLPNDANNLVVRAANCFFDQTGLRREVALHLHKEIPHGGGLGGGSSDAAATLKGLNQLYQTNLDHGTLHKWAAALGSDVPFFLSTTAARCTGRGEKVVSMTLDQSADILLVKPPFGVPTPWAYRKWAASSEVPEFHYAPQPSRFGELVNDLERPVFEKYYLLGLIKNRLLESDIVEAALMSGSGATLLAILKDEVDTEPLAADLRRSYGETLWVRRTQLRLE